MVEGAARYQPIQTSIWTDEKFCAFTDDQKLLWMYLLTCPHSNMLGLYRLPAEYAAADLKWDVKRFRERFRELLAKGFLDHDPETNLIFVKNHLKHRPIENENQAKAAIKVADTLPKTHLISSLLESLERLGKPFTKRLQERLQERYAKPVNREPLSVNREPITEKSQKLFVATPKNPESRRLAELLFSLIRERDPKSKQPNLDNWASHVDLLMRVDSRDPEEIETIIRWCQADEFWKNNILSTATLRKQFQRLALQAKPTDPLAGMNKTQRAIIESMRKDRENGGQRSDQEEPVQIGGSLPQLKDRGGGD